jgi:hypothetical protein
MLVFDAQIQAAAANLPYCCIQDENLNTVTS